MNEEKRDTKCDYTIRGMLCVLDLAYPYEMLTDKAKSTKSFLRKRIMDYVHQIEYENSQTKEE
jgi:hypothetical protein